VKFEERLLSSEWVSGTVVDRKAGSISDESKASIADLVNGIGSNDGGDLKGSEQVHKII
jgi:hypothetical protein